MSDFADGYDDERDDPPGVFTERILCEECGREYEARVTFSDPAYDSPASYEPEPGEERCPACRLAEDDGAG